MPIYRRAFVPGGCFFFTVNLLERKQTLLVDHIAHLREAVATTRAEIIPSRQTHSSCCPTICMRSGPGGLRCLDALAADQAVLPERGQNGIDSVPFAMRAWAERGIWQRRFWEHLIRVTPTTHDMSNIATSIRSSTAWSSACATVRIHRFIATWARGCFRSIGAAISKRSVSLVSGGTGEAPISRAGLPPGMADYAFGSSPPYGLTLRPCVEFRIRGPNRASNAGHR